MSGSLFGGIKSNAITVFAGPEASGKTFLTLNAARDGIVMLHCATGSDYAGGAGFRLWFAAETNKA